MSLINDMLHDLARRDRSHARPPHDARAYDPLPRAHPLPSAPGLDSRHWWHPLLWLNLVLVAALLALGGAWWLQSPPGWPFVPSALPATTAQAPAVAPMEQAANTGASDEPSALPSPATPAQPDLAALTGTAVPEPVPAPSIDSITLSGIATAPALDRPPVVTRRVTGLPDPVPTPPAGTAPLPAAAPASPSAPVVVVAAAPTPPPPPPARNNPPASPKPPLPTAPSRPTAAASVPAATPAAAVPGSRTVAAPAQPVVERPAPAPVAAAAATAPSAARQAPPASPPTESSAEWAETRLQQARAERKQGAAEAAMQTFKTLLDRQPQHVAARLELAALLQERKQAAAAAELLSEGLMLLPRQTRFTLALAPLWIQAGQQADAMLLLEQGARHASPKDGPYHAYYASQLLRLKRPVQAQQHFELAVASDPGRGEWLLGLGLALQANGRTQEAIAALQRASASGQLAPQNKAMVDQAIARLQTGS